MGIEPAVLVHVGYRTETEHQLFDWTADLMEQRDIDRRMGNTAAMIGSKLINTWEEIAQEHDWARARTSTGLTDRRQCQLPRALSLPPLRCRCTRPS